MKNTLLLIMFFVSSIINSQITHSRGTKYPKAKQLTTIEKIPLMNANGKINFWITPDDFKTSLGLINQDLSNFLLKTGANLGDDNFSLSTSKFLYLSGEIIDLDGRVDFTGENSRFFKIPEFTGDENDYVFTDKSFITKKYFDENSSSGSFLPLSGGKMTGAIDSNNKAIKNVTNLDTEQIELKVNGQVFHRISTGIFEGDDLEFVNAYTGLPEHSYALAFNGVPHEERHLTTKKYVDEKIKDSVTESKEYLEQEINKLPTIIQSEGDLSISLNSVNGESYTALYEGKYKRIGDRVDFVINIVNAAGGTADSGLLNRTNLTINIAEPIEGSYINDTSNFNSIQVKQMTDWGQGFYSIIPSIERTVGAGIVFDLKDTLSGSITSNRLKNNIVTNASIIISGYFYLE